MRADELVKAVESLSHAARCRKLASVRGEPGLVRELGQRGHYERSLALTIAVAGRDEDYLAEACRDRDPELAGRAISAAVRLKVAGEVFDELVEGAPAAVRAALYRAIRRHRRQDLAERLIERTAARWGDREAARLLPACGSEVAERWLDDLAYAVSNWAALARSHPLLVLGHAERELAELPVHLHREWWSRQAPGIAVALPYAPERVIGLLERHWGAEPLPWALERGLGLLIDVEPERVVALLVHPDHKPYLGGLLARRSVRSRLADPQVARAVREDSGALALVLKGAPPSEREALFDAAAATQPIVADAVLELLPHARRVREARRMLALREVAENPRRVLELTAFLPFGEAAGVLREETRRADPMERARGYALLLRCAGRSRDPEVLTEALNSLTRLRNEQDPVRLAALEALVAVPPTLIEGAHVPALSRLFDEALAARDRSYGTLQALSMLIVGAFRQGALENDLKLTRFAAEALPTLGNQGVSLYLGRLDLPRGSAHDLVRGLAPQLEQSAKRGDHTLAHTLAQALGRRGYDIPELQDALEQAAQDPRDFVTRWAVDHWLRPPATRSERLERLLATDRSMITLPGVFAVIARERTDLLDRVLRVGPPTGRFWKWELAYVPTAQRSWLRRWTGRQHAAYLKLLHVLARDDNAPKNERENAIRVIGDVPGVGVSELRRYLRSPDASLRRTALTAAAWTATPQDALGELLALATSDDAHVALYAATRCARFTRPDDLAAVLAPVLTDGKVTARKEAVRLAAHHRVPGADDIIAAVWDAEGQHPDVRIAVASAARQLLDRPASARILTEAAAGPRDLARQVLGWSPLLVQPRRRDGYSRLIVTVAASTDPEVRDEALAALPRWAPWAPTALTTLAAGFTELGRTSSWRAAMNGLLTCAFAGQGLAELEAAVATLTAAGSLPDAEEDRDRPALRRLEALVCAAHGRPKRPEVIDALARVLPDLLATRLIAVTVHWDEPDPVAALAARPVNGTLETLAVAKDLARTVDRAEPQDVLPHAVRLGGLFATELIAVCGPRAGWPEPWRALLSDLREHPDRDVAYRAGQIHTARE